MLLKIFQLITNLQEQLGNDSRVGFDSGWIGNVLRIRVDWPKRKDNGYQDYHTIYSLSKSELESLSDDELNNMFLDSLVFKFRHQYDQQKEKVNMEELLNLLRNGATDSQISDAAKNLFITQDKRVKEWVVNEFEYFAPCKFVFHIDYRGEFIEGNILYGNRSYLFA